MTVRRAAAFVAGFCVVVAACADSGPRTIRFTNALGFDYTILAFDNADTASRDTVLVVPSGTQVCWRLSESKAIPVMMELDSYQTVGGIIIGSVAVEPRFDSWTWDGVSSKATAAPAC